MKLKKSMVTMTQRTIAEIEQTEWAKDFAADSPVSYPTALKYAQQAGLEVFIEQSDATGELVWAVRVLGDPDFWMEAKPTKAQALAVCREMGWKVVRRNSERNEAMKKHPTVKAAEALAEEKATKLSVAQELVRQLEREHSAAREAVRRAQEQVDASLPQCSLVQVNWHSGKAVNVGRLVVLRKTPGGMLVARRVGDCSGAELKFKWQARSKKYLEAKKQAAYVSDQMELRDVPEAYTGPSAAG